jgi:hypothetical protein
MEPDLSISLPPLPPGEDEQPSSKGDGEGSDGSSSDSSSPDTLLILDAKYRIESGLSDAIASIHTYRDALVEDQGDHQPRIVNGAYLLSPREPDDSGQDWKKTDMPYRLFHPKYRGQFHFGAATLRPGMSLDEVHDALEAILEDTGTELGEGNPQTDSV